jgi:superfamily II DNA or RNA helicase
VSLPGEIRRGKDGWEIDAEPHVLLRLKRVFGRIYSNAKQVKLSDTLEVGRDLVWFLQRYPLRMTHEDRLYLEKRAEQYVDRASDVEEMLDTDYVPPPFSDMVVPAREYQRFAADMFLRTRGLLLADDVGLGKTASAITALTDRRCLPALVVTLTHLPKQWDAEIKKFAPWMSTHVIESTKSYDFRLPPLKEGGRKRMPDVTILNYHKLTHWAPALSKRVKTVVYDEVQELRHRKNGNRISLRYEAAARVSERAEYRLGLSATPVFNRGGEMHSIMGILRPDALGTAEEFLTEWGGARETVRDPKAFGAYLRAEGLMLRRTRSEVGRELEALSRIPHQIEADTEAIDRIAGQAAELARVILGGNELMRGDKWRASDELSMRLRQATGIAKAPYVAEFVRLLVESGEKVVLFAWHREVYDVLMAKLVDLSPALYTGTENTAQKELARKRFIDGETNVLMMSLRSGAGLDGLQFVSRTVVFAELDWSPAVHEQCCGRVHRDGQTDPVCAYFLLSDHGSDPIIADVLGLKQNQIEGIRDPNADLIETLQVGEGNAKKLAEAFLRQRGMDVPVPPPPPEPPASYDAIDRASKKKKKVLG